MSRTFLSRLLRILPYAVSATLIFLVFWTCRQSLSKIPSAMLQADPFLFALAMLSGWVALFVVSLRLRLMFSTIGAPGGPFRYAYYTVIGMVASNLVPSTGGADLVKSLFMARDLRLPKTQCVTIALADRAIGMLTILVVAAIALRHSFAESPYARSAAGWAAVCVSIAFILLAFESFLPETNALKIKTLALLDRLRLGRLVEPTRVLLRSPGVLLSAVAITLVVYFFYIVTAWILSLAIGVAIPFAVFVALIPAVFIGMLLPSTAGLGVREALFLLFLKGYVEDEKALALSFLYYAVFLLSSLIGGLFLLVRGWPRLKTLAEQE